VLHAPQQQSDAPHVLRPNVHAIRGANGRQRSGICNTSGGASRSLHDFPCYASSHRNIHSHQ
jgi:hypothetical protein